MHNIKHIFVGTFGISDINNQHPILDQLVYISDKNKIVDIETNDKLMQWLEQKYLARVSMEHEK